MYEFIIYLISAAKAGGISSVSACNLDSPADTAPLLEWLSRGMNAGMGYMQNNISIRRDPTLLVDGARSIIVFTFPYHNGTTSPDGMKISGFASGNDYHNVLKKRMRDILDNSPEEFSYRVFADSAPILERYWASRCGLGTIGKNNFLISHASGARVLIGCAVTTRPFTSGEIRYLTEHIPVRKELESACEGCSLCIRACPNGALGGKGRLDARRCISYNTVESREEMPEDLNTAGWILGCEECLKACPYEYFTGDDTVIPDELGCKTDLLSSLDSDDWIHMDRDNFRKKFRGTAFERPGLEKIKHNITHNIKCRDRYDKNND